MLRGLIELKNGRVKEAVQPHLMGLALMALPFQRITDITHSSAGLGAGRQQHFDCAIRHSLEQRHSLELLEPVIGDDGRTAEMLE